MTAITHHDSLDAARRSREFQKVCDLIAEPSFPDDPTSHSFARATLGRVAYELEHFDLAMPLLLSGALGLTGADEHLSSQRDWLVGLARVCSNGAQSPMPRALVSADAELVYQVVYGDRRSLRQDAHARVRAMENDVVRSESTETALWHLRLALCRSYRRDLAFEPWNSELADQGQRYMDHVFRLGESDADRFDEVLAMVPLQVTVTYERAAFAFARGDLHGAYELAERLLVMPTARGHLAATSLALQAAHALGLDRAKRRSLARSRLDHLTSLPPVNFVQAIEACCRESQTTEQRELDTNAVELALESRGEDFKRSKAKLCRHLARIESTWDYQAALDYRERADGFDRDGQYRRYGHLRYLALKGARRQLVEATDRLLYDWSEYSLDEIKLPEHIERADPEIGPSSDQRIDRMRKAMRAASGTGSTAVERSLLAIGDSLRAAGLNVTALTWFDVMAMEYPHSGYAASRFLSLQVGMGRVSEALQSVDLLERSETLRDAGDVLQLHIGRALLEHGQFDEAEQRFRVLVGETTENSASATPWAQTRVNAWCGLLDIARYRRELDTARDIYADAQAELTDVDASLVAEVAIAMGWAEMQLGNPAVALRMFSESLCATPYSISGWIGVVRALRLLGRPRDAEVQLNLLLGRRGRAHRPAIVTPTPADAVSCDVDGNPSQPAWARDSKVPDLRLIHEPTLLNELGWCYVDQDKDPAARAEFEAALERAPYRVSSHRGLIAASGGRVGGMLRLLDERSRVLQDWFPGGADLALRDLNLEAGRVLIRSRRIDQAENLFNEVLDLLWADPPDQLPRRRALYTMADAYLDERLHEPADEILDRVRSFIGSEEADHDERFVLLRAKSLLIQQQPGQARHEIEAYCTRVRGKAGLQQLAGEDRNSGVVAGHSYAIQLAYLIALFEGREFDLIKALAAEFQLNHHEHPIAGLREGRLPGSDLVKLVEGWATLAESELPQATREEARDLVIPLSTPTEANPALDIGLVDVLHYQAIVAARTAVLDRADAGRAPTAFDSATRLMTEALNRRPNDSGLLRDMGALYLATDRFADAAAVLDKAKQLNPQDARIHLLRGVGKYKQRRLQAAISDFRMAVACDPIDYVHHRTLVLSLLEAGDIREASAALEYATRVVGPHAQMQMLLLEVRMLAEQAERLEPPARRKRLTQLERNLTNQRAEAGPELKEQLLIRAFLLARSGNIRGARRRIQEAKREEGSNSAVENLELQLGGRQGLSRFIERNASLLAFVAAVLGLAATATVAIAGEIAGRTILWNYLFIAGGVSVAVFVLSLFPSRLSAIEFREVAVRLEVGNPADEVVHVDLDLSTSRLIRISGFSNHRPGIPFDVVDRRVVE